MAKTEAIDNPKLNALGRYYDRHGEDEAEWGEALKPSNFGCGNVVDAARKHLAAAAAMKKKAERKMYSFRLPVFVVDGLKKKAKAQHKPYQRFVNEILATAAS
ncbi:hypothetical protein R83H12_00165 [Fibrobacteria bacterium R8-3-H12]